MRHRYTLLSAAVAVVFVGAAACTESGADDRPVVEADTAAVVSSFQDRARARLDMVDSLIDEARMQVDSATGAQQPELQTRLDEFASRSNELEQRIRSLVWRNEMEWQTTTQAIESDIDQLRTDVNVALAPGATSDTTGAASVDTMPS